MIQTKLVDGPTETRSLDEKIAHQRWQFAKTYARTAPHEYIIRAWNPELFDELARMITEQGVNKPFTLFGKTNTYKYLYYGAFKFWRIQVVLNREKVE